MTRSSSRSSLYQTRSDSVSFSVPAMPTGPHAVPLSLRELAPGLSVSEYGGRGFMFGHVLSRVLRRGLVLTDNRRLPMRTRFTGEELSEPMDLRDGSGLAAALYALKNGGPDEQERFGRVQAAFRDLTGRLLELRVRHLPRHEEGGMVIEPVVVHGGLQRPVEFCGAGVQEALLMSVLLDEAPGRVIVLDEPAVNLEPTVQRRLLRQLRGPGQCVVITHHADLVPVEEPADLGRVVRIVPGASGSRPLRPSFDGLGEVEARRWLRLLEPSHVRSLLFAPAVILCEGATEIGALSRWWRIVGRIGLRDPEAANIPLVDVGGQKGFGAYVRYLDAFSIPWAIVADGPALRDDGDMSKQLARLRRRPDPLPADRDDFAAWREYWEGAGVFTVATEFGDGGGKRGEFEELLRRTDESLLGSIRCEVGRGAKPTVGAWFAEEHPEPPEEVLDLARKIAAWPGFGLLHAKGELAGGRKAG